MGKNSPMFATYFVTDRCNVRCKGCLYYENLSEELGDRELNTEGAITVLRRLAEGGVPVVGLAGGEPFLRRDLPELLEAGHAAGLSLSLVSNAMKLYDEGLDAVDRYCSWALYSPHVPSELEGKKADEQYERGWKGFARMRAALTRPRLICAVNINKYTVDHLEEIFDRALETGADAIKFQPNFVKSVFPSKAQVAEVVGRMKRWKKSHPQFVMGRDDYFDQFSRYFGEQPHIACTANRRFHLGVQADGVVSACCPEYVPIGNLVEQPLREMLAEPLGTRDDCYGCHRLDISQALKLTGRRAR
jgi:MoaA/NifB/PqqE/SkfB family radical SAM enzyme